MSAHDISAFRAECEGRWQGLIKEEPSHARRNLYALSAGFILFVVGQGTIHDASFFDGSVQFKEAWVLQVSACLLLLYSWWRFEMTRHIAFVDLWAYEYQSARFHTAANRALALRTLPTGWQRQRGTEPRIQVSWRRRSVDIDYDVGVNQAGQGQGAPPNTRLGGTATLWAYLHTVASASAVVVVRGRAFSDIALPRIMLVLAVVAAGWRFFHPLSPPLTDAVPFTDFS